MTCPLIDSVLRYYYPVTVITYFEVCYSYFVYFGSSVLGVQILMFDISS